MIRFRRGLAAAIVLTISGADGAHAQSVHGTCVGSFDANGNYTSGSAGGCSDTPPPSTGPGPGLSPSQQWQLDAARDVTSAATTAFMNWLLEPDPNFEPAARQRALNQSRQRYFGNAEQRKRDAQEIHEEAAATAGDFIGLGAQRELQSHDLGASGSLSSQQQHTVTGLMNDVHTIDCAMSDVYGAADKLGPEGKGFSKALNQDVIGLIEAKLPARPREQDGTTYDVATLSRHLESEGGKTGAQIHVSVVVSRNAETGTTTIIVGHAAQKTSAGFWTKLMHPLGGWRKAREGESVVLLDRSGNVMCQQLTSVAAACMKQYDEAYGAQEYCPHPPTEKHP